ncbi:hypothetical protein P7K49_022134 [Saguinus oedipus]|uniref:Uncharacterized protein n=1 Tax=Saguinus oedipus TaxID=9490 RepID=A0ABQ9UUR1_SAGOE|nr:hypothetical protein P7K49_022134 [Saguinus oedipus]
MDLNSHNSQRVMSLRRLLEVNLAKNVIVRSKLPFMWRLSLLESCSQPVLSILPTWSSLSVLSLLRPIDYGEQLQDPNHRIPCTAAASS